MCDIHDFMLEAGTFFFFLVKGQIITVLSFVGHLVSVFLFVCLFVRCFMVYEVLGPGI